MEHARRLIFDLGRSVGGELDILKRGSLILTRVPISLSPSHIHSYCDPQNAYHTELGVNPATIMPVDILHDCELGVGKGLITHNIRILHTVGEGAVNTFDARCQGHSSPSVPSAEVAIVGIANYPRKG